MENFRFTKEDKEMRFYIPGYENPVILNLATKIATSPAGNVIKSFQGYFSNIDVRDVLAGSPSPEYANFLHWFIADYKSKHGVQLTNCGTIINKLCEAYARNKELLNRMEQFYVSYKFTTAYWPLRAYGLRWCMDNLSSKTLHIIAEINPEHTFDIDTSSRYFGYSSHYTFDQTITLICKAWNLKKTGIGMLGPTYTQDDLKKGLATFINTIIQKYYKKDIFMLEFIINEAFRYLPQVYALQTQTDAYILLEQLFQYWLNEKLYPTDSISFLRDYWYMQESMKSCNYTKYPKYLRTVHDVVSFNYKSTDFSDSQKEKFVNNIRKNFDYIGRKYCILTPKDIEDVRKEGSSLNHCVLSYVKRCIDTTDHQIVFLRKNDDIISLETPLVTLHIYKNAVIHARGYNNRLPDTNEINAIVEYCSIKGLTLADVDIKTK